MAAVINVSTAAAGEGERVIEVIRMRSAGWRAGVAALAVVAGSAACWPSASVAATNVPTFALTSTVIGQAAPVPLYRSNGWQEHNGVWSLDIHLVAPPAGVTKFVATWRTPTLSVRKGSWLFRDDIAVLHQGVADDRSSDSYRICVVKSKRKTLCSTWYDSSNATPNAASVPFVWLAVSTNDGWELRWSEAPAHVYVEWRATITQDQPDEAHDVLQVAAGNSADHLTPALPSTCVDPNGLVCRPI